MSNLPKITWDIDPVFLPIPKDLVIAIAGAIAVYSLIQGMRRKGSDHYTTAFLFGALALVAWKFMGEALELRYYSLLFVAVFLGGYSLLKWQITRAGGPASDAGDFIVYGVLGVLVGARVGHVLFYDLDKALSDPMWVFKIWTGGLASHGAVLGLIFVMWLFCKRKGIPFLEGADRFAYSATLGATLVRVGNLMNSEIVGRKTDQSWGFQFPRFDRDLPVVPYRYPTQLGEIVLGCLVMAGLYFIDKRLGEEKRPRGAMIASFFALYFPGRFLVEFYKEYEGPLEAGSALTMGQVLSIPGILIGWIGLYLALKKKVPAKWPQANDDEDEAPKRKKKPKNAKKATKPAAAPDDEDEDERNDGEKDEPARDDDERDDDERDDDERDDDDHPADDEDDDGESAPHSERPERDSDIDDEFDDKGALKRRRD
jgi:phosphatidylglycerol:prolipoprotein diacylglycerol transferase